MIRRMNIFFLYFKSHFLALIIGAMFNVIRIGCCNSITSLLFGFALLTCYVALSMFINNANLNIHKFRAIVMVRCSFMLLAICYAWHFIHCK